MKTAEIPRRGAFQPLNKCIDGESIEVKIRRIVDETYEQRVQKLTEEIALIQKEGAVNESMVDVNYNQARKIQREVENFYYDMITKRMSAEAAKEQAANMLQKIKNDLELGKGHLSVEQEKNLREWIYGGINQITDIVGVVGKLKNSKQVIEKMAKRFK